MWESVIREDVPWWCCIISKVLYCVEVYYVLLYCMYCWVVPMIAGQCWWQLFCDSLTGLMWQGKPLNSSKNKILGNFFIFGYFLQLFKTFLHSLYESSLFRPLDPCFPPYRLGQVELTKVSTFYILMLRQETSRTRYAGLLVSLSLSKQYLSCVWTDYGAFKYYVILPL